MRERLLRFGRGKRRRGVLIGGVACVAALGALMISSAFAVHDRVFQLDGDVDSSTTTSVGGTTQTIDWDQFINADGTLKTRPADFTASSFDQDFVVNANGTFNKSDSSTWATGSKDTLAITPGWQCKRDQNLLNKNDIMNAYAAAYEPAGGDEVLYFALERNGNEGAANVGFWFLQDNNVNCESPGGNTAFTGNHVTGDLLVVSEFTNGGTVSTINVYEWVGGANGSLNPDPVASGADCETTTVPPSDEACATVNDADITTPWLTATKDSGVGHTLQAREFFEGGVNLTASGLGGKCFSTFIASTRASQELGANLHDFSRGSLGGCISTTETTPLDGSGNPIPADGLTIPTDPSDSGLQVRDKATITVTGADSFEGTVTFHLCGPFEASSTTLCGTGGVLVSSHNITTNGDYLSDAATVTSAGRYCWRADFTSTTQGVPPSSDSRASECFKVNPVKPALTTQAGEGPVDFGNPVTDTATLTGTAHRPGTGGPSGSTDGSINPATPGGDAQGTITFTLYKDTPGPNNCSVLATGTGTNPQTVSVNGDGTYGPVSFTPDAPGLYHWVASYGGDPPNTLASDASACLDENEDVVVRRIDTAISTTQRVLPQDSATITSAVAGENLPAGGTVIFRLYGPTDGSTALANCLAHGDTVGQGGLLFKESDTGVGGSESVTTSTNNTDVFVSDSVTVYWRVTYDPNDAAFTGRQSDCIENTVTTFNNDAGPGTLFP
jgi:hypothetical protein